MVTLKIGIWCFPIVSSGSRGEGEVYLSWSILFASFLCFRNGFFLTLSMFWWFLRPYLLFSLNSHVFPHFYPIFFDLTHADFSKSVRKSIFVDFRQKTEVCWRAPGPQNHFPKKPRQQNTRLGERYKSLPGFPVKLRLSCELDETPWNIFYETE